MDARSEGEFTVTYEATSTPRGHNIDTPWNITLRQPNRGPNIFPISDKNITTGRSWTFRPNANDPDEDDVLTWSATNLPAWAFFNTANGQITGIPNLIGTTAVTLSVTDGSLTDSITFNINVTRLQTPHLPDINDKQYSAETAITPFVLPTVQNVPGSSYSYALTNRPSWILYNTAVRTVSGTTPAATSESTLTYTATKTSGTNTPGAFVYTNTFKISVVSDATLNQPNLPWQKGDIVPVTTNLATVQGGPSGVTYTYALTGTYTNQLVYFSATNLLSAKTDPDTFVATGRWPVNLTATGSDGNTYTSSFIIEVTDIPAGTLDQENLTYVVNNAIRPVNFARVVGGPSGALYDYTIEPTTGPAGMTLTADSLSGTPTAIQRTRHVLTATVTTTRSRTMM